MSLPRFLYSDSTLEKPLLPAHPPAVAADRQTDREERVMSSSRKIDASDEVLSGVYSALETHSFTSEPIHRFGGNAAAAATAVPPVAAVQSVASEAKFTGGVDANSAPEVAAFATGGELRQFSRSKEYEINCDPGDKVYYKNDKDRTKWEEAALYIREGELNDKFYSHPTGKWSKIAYNILHHPVFHVFDLSLSVLLMLLALIESPAVFDTDPHKMAFVTLHGILELIILGLLGVDIILRLVWLTPYHFVRHRRTMFITLVLCMMYIEAIVVLIRQDSHLRITRSLRPIFLIDTYLMFGVRRVLRQIFQSLKQISDVILLLFFVVAFFALIAYYLFAEVDPTYFDTFGLSFVSLFITTTTANNPDVMMEAYSREDGSPIFFVIYLVLTLYFVSNILLAVVYSNFSEEEKEKFRKLFLHKREALRHAFKVLTGRTGIEFHDFILFMQHYKPRIPEWQVMCEFKALHLNPSEQHAELSEREFFDFYEVQNLKWREVTAEGRDVLWFQKFPPAVKAVFQKIYMLVTWEWFNSIIYIVILVNMVFLVLFTAFITEAEAEDRFERLKIVLPVSFLFLLVYIVENILKILALGPVGYFKKFWNMCDFLVLTLSLIALFLELDPRYHSLAVIRPIKLIRVIRLKRRYRDIMNTLVVLTPRLLSVFFLLLIIYYFFAILGMEVFQGKVSEGCCENASYMVGDYYQGSRNDTTTAVYYLNNFDNLLRSYVTLFMLMVVNNWYIIMEGFASEVSHHWPARIYFMAFYIVTLVVLQVVIAFIVEAFVLQLEQSNRKKEKLEKKILERRLSVMERRDDTDCVEDQHRKKEVRIGLLSEDIAKLRYEMTYIGEKEGFSFDHLVRRYRRVKLPNEQQGMQCSGRRLRTKDDLHLWKYRADIEQWIQEQDNAFRQVETSLPSSRPLKEKLWSRAKTVMTYLLE